MPEPLSVFQLILNASLTVKLVMLLLCVASIVSWVFIVQRFLYFKAANEAFEYFEQEFWSGVDLSELFRRGNAKQQNGEEFIGAESIFRAGFKEYSRLRNQAGMDGDAVLAGVQRAMRVASSKEEDEMDRHLSFLASVGSISPYVGLFGTVWGIMNSFQGLAVMHQATLAAVAPGISEALVATAMGLFAAIPAVLAYNRYTANLDKLLSRYDTFTEEFSAILHRQVYNRSA